MLIAIALLGAMMVVPGAGVALAVYPPDGAPSEHRDFLERYGVEYVLALRNKRFGYGAGWPRASVRALDEAPYLEQLFRERDYSVYRVDRADGNSRELPGPLGSCRTAPLQPYEPFQS